MTNPKNSNVTPKTVAETAAEKVDVTVKATAVDPTEKATKTVPSQNKGEDQDVSTDGETNVKLSLVQRVKAAAQKISKDPKSMYMLGVSTVVVGLLVNNKRRNKAVSVEPLDTAESPVFGRDDVDDSL